MKYQGFKGSTSIGISQNIFDWNDRIVVVSYNVTIKGNDLSSGLVIGINNNFILIPSTVLGLDASEGHTFQELKNAWGRAFH